MVSPLPLPPLLPNQWSVLGWATTLPVKQKIESCKNQDDRLNRTIPQSTHNDIDSMAASGFFNKVFVLINTLK